LFLGLPQVAESDSECYVVNAFDYLIIDLFKEGRAFNKNVQGTLLEEIKLAQY